ncbi:MAG: alternative ribosome rescue aminoacyl-tRNA hydrolase ArfB [Flavisolibacter sp.]
MIDLSTEIRLTTTRSGGKGGQNVNKLETAVIAYFDIAGSRLLTENQKAALVEKLANRINAEGSLVVRTQTYRTQMENKQEAIRKVQELVRTALQRKKPRIATKPSRQSKEIRLEHKKRSSQRKEGRKKLYPPNHF